MLSLSHLSLSNSQAQSQPSFRNIASLKTIGYVIERASATRFGTLGKDYEELRYTARCQCVMKPLYYYKTTHMSNVLGGSSRVDERAVQESINMTLVK